MYPLHRTFSALSPLQWLAPLAVSLIWISLFSLLKEPTRRRFSAIMVAGAGAAYLNGGFGPWEFLFCSVITVLSYRGLENYRIIGLAWVLHAAWDVVHHWYGNPIVPFAPVSSAGCAICDPVLAVWYWCGAPTLFRDFRALQRTPPQLGNGPELGAAEHPGAKLAPE